METLVVAEIVAAYLFCGAFAYAITFAHFQRKFHMLAEKEKSSDRRLAISMGSLGPIGLLASMWATLACGPGFWKTGVKWN